MVSAPPETTEPRARRLERGFGGLLLVLAAVLATALAVTLASRLSPVPRRTPFDPSPLVGIKRQRPDLIIIGNSMVYTRLERKLLGDLVEPTRIRILAYGGTQSAIWYAQLKYYVVASGVKVKRVVLFFRDRELTLARARTHGTFSGPLERTIPGKDKLIESKLAPRARVPLDHVRLGLAELAPVDRIRERATTLVDGLAMRVAGLAAKRRSAGQDKKDINHVFAVERLRDVDAEKTASWDDPRSFPDVIAESFLPDMIKLTRDNGIELTVVRVRRRRTAAGLAESSELSAYTAQLRRYLERENVKLVDLSSASWESLRLYGNGDHIAPRHRRLYTRLIVQHYPGLFKLP